jgi:hypothetical protein
MAFTNPILNPRTGVVAVYWRIVLLTIAPADMSARIVLGGYTSGDVRMAGGVPVDQRAYDLGPQQFVALAQAATGGPTLFDAIGGSCYEYIRNARRPVTIDPDSGEAILLDGSRRPADQILMIGNFPTVPSEFADAQDV